MHYAAAFSTPAFSTTELMRLIAELQGLPPVHAAPAVAASSLPFGADAAPWHALPAEPTLNELAVSAETGLCTAEAAARLRRIGPNLLPRPQPRGVAAIFTEQLTGLPVLLLGASALVSLATGGLADAVVILAVVLANGVIATATERQAERTIMALDENAAAPVPVLRGGRRMALPPEVLVPGDILIAEPGTPVPADARLLTATQLTVNESALTGESLPVAKSAEAALPADAPLADRTTMLFCGTAVTGGAGRAVVVATGSATEIGRIQALLGSVRPPETPIQRELDQLGRRLVWVNGAICLGVLGLGLARGRALLPTMKSAISLAVAAVPEGLPTVATTTLAMGVRQMRREGVLVRRLDAAETLGAVQVLCLDKTGTLTRNVMAVVAARVPAGACIVQGAALVPESGLDSDIAGTEMLGMFELASLCSDVTLETGGLVGSPTEVALVRAARDLGADIAALRALHPRLATAPRSDGRKRMATTHALPDGRRFLAVKGDPVEVLALCDRRLDGRATAALGDAERAAIRSGNDAMAGHALRVLGVAYGEASENTPHEAGLVWCGLAGIADPLRGDAKAAIARELDLAGGPEISVLEAKQLDAARPEVLRALAAAGRRLRPGQPGAEAASHPCPAGQWRHRGDDRRRRE